MRIFILVLLVFNLFNCTKKEAAIKPVEFYFINNNRHFMSQSTYAEVAEYVKRIIGEYELVYKKEVEFNKKKIAIKKFSNIKTAAIDGDAELFYIDTLLIYQRGVNWTDAFRTLQSSNDSINKLVSFSLASIMGNPNLFYPEHTKFQFEELNRLRSQKK